MELGRRDAIAGAGLAALASTGLRQVSAAEAVSAWAHAFAPDGSTVRVLSVETNADGKATVTDKNLPADHSPYPLFKQFLTHKASAVAIYRAPPAHRFEDGKPTKILLLIVDGALQIGTDGAKRTAGPGEFVLFDGVAKSVQRAGKAGYVAIKIALAD